MGEPGRATRQRLQMEFELPMKGGYGRFVEERDASPSARDHFC
jgi:hypothetical protein